MSVGVKLRGVSGELWQGANKVAAMTSYEISVDGKDADASDHDSGAWGETITTTFMWSATVNCWYLDGDTNQGLLDAAMIAGTSLAFQFRPNGTGAGKSKIDGNGRISSLKLGAPQDGVQSWNASVRGVGALVWGTQ